MRPRTGPLRSGGVQGAGLMAAGCVATAISYGPGRMGYGLFVPEFRSAFAMSTSDVGYVSSVGFLGFSIGLVVAQVLLGRRGPRAPVVAGLAAATAGMAIVALAPSLPALAIGVFLATSSAGFAWTPFNDVVHRKVRDIDRPTALSEISTGTSVGIIAAGLAALGMVAWDLSWRVCWALFSLFAAVALVVNGSALRHVEKAVGAGSARGWREVLDPVARPLFVIAFVFGTTSAIYLSFAPDHLRSVGGLAGVPAAATPALVFIGYGLFGLLGLLTGRLVAVIGLPWLVRLLMLAGASSIALVATLPGSWAGVIASAGLQGLYVMATSAVLALWSERLFPSLPSLSFTAALVAAAAGSVLGPAAAGVVAETVGAWAMFLGTAALPAFTAVVLADRHVRDRPVRTTRPRRAG